MQPLKVRSGSSSPIESRAIELLRSIERYQPPLGQKQRVRIRLLERSVPRRSMMLWPAFVGALLLIAAGASAALSGHWLRLGHPVKTTEAVSQSLNGLVVPSLKSRGEPAGDPSKLPDAELPAAASKPPALAVESPARVDPTPRVENTARATQPSEKVLVFDAMRALRREGHPERAAKLLDEYLRRCPEGSLSEEALALSIEAATALSDPKARNLADRYLARYPDGRFRPAAERARARFAP